MGGKLPRGLWTAANVVMLLAFLFSVAVQYNDPDPLRWMAVYGAGAAVCCAELVRRTRPGYPLAVALVALGWAATIAPRVLGVVRFADMFAEFEMKNAGVEESREMYGLLIVAVWMGLVALATGLRSARRRA
ncbi:MAG TPA: transmembrane 220 family protein [Gemmatimonadales bacterium]|jgi:hypothetical protein|nr:transmembrane 220 family protein [Gemmatimonadales bacterium]